MLLRLEEDRGRESAVSWRFVGQGKCELRKEKAAPKDRFRSPLITGYGAGGASPDRMPVKVPVNSAAASSSPQLPVHCPSLMLVAMLAAL